MPGPLPSPLGGPVPSEMSLTRSPLVRVLAQVRFSSVLKIDSREGVAPLQEELRSIYPLLEQLTAQQMQFDLSSGTPSVRPIASTVWRFSSSDRSLILSLTSDAMTLEARQYEGRSAFLSRWSDVLRRVERIFVPGLALRTGVRYVNRLESESLVRLTEWVRPNLVGVAQPDLRDYVTQAISEASMMVEEGDLLLRWGVLPAGASIDPMLLEAVGGASWTLDIDVSVSKQKAFAGEALTAEFQGLAERAYAVFRWVITEAGLKHFGARA